MICRASLFPSSTSNSSRERPRPVNLLAHRWRRLSGTTPVWGLSCTSTLNTRWRALSRLTARDIARAARLCVAFPLLIKTSLAGRECPRNMVRGRGSAVRWILSPTKWLAGSTMSVRSVWEKQRQVNSVWRDTPNPPFTALFVIPTTPTEGWGARAVERPPRSRQGSFRSPPVLMAEGRFGFLHSPAASSGGNLRGGSFRRGPVWNRPLGSPSRGCSPEASRISP